MKRILVLLLLALAAPAMAASVAWLHHSVGRNLISEGDMRALLECDLWDHDYNQYCGDNWGVRRPDGSHTGYDWNIPGDENCGDTSPGGLDMLITLPSAARDSLLKHDVVILKSCYSDARFNSDAELNNAKAHYLSMAASMATFDNVFIICSPPPSHRLAVTSSQATRSRDLANWMGALGGGNIIYYNLYEALAGVDDFLAYDYERWHSYPDSHPNVVANLVVSYEMAIVINTACDPNTGVQVNESTSWGDVKTIWR